MGDQTSAVTTNLAKIQANLGDGLHHSPKIFSGKQVHGKNTALITAISPSEIANCDSLMTNEPYKALMIRHADCQATLFYDPKNRAIANVHAGWKGSVLNIYAETIGQMQKVFGSKPADLIVCVSPSLGPDNAEFIHFAEELPEEFWSFQITPNHFDFWAITTHQLQNEGILPSHIEMARIDTYSAPEDYFSYRRDKITGRHATCILLT